MKRTHVILTTVGAALLGFLAGPTAFLPVLRALFPDFRMKIVALPADEVAAATTAFGVAAGLLLALTPGSALVTERFAARAHYLAALAKSMLFGLLAFGASWFYQHEHLASVDRLAAKMPGLFGPNGALPATLAGNPLTKIVWFTVICMLIFGPLDLWIARLQKQWRTRPDSSSALETAADPASLPEK